MEFSQKIEQTPADPKLRKAFEDGVLKFQDGWRELVNTYAPTGDAKTQLHQIINRYLVEQSEAVMKGGWMYPHDTLTALYEEVVRSKAPAELQELLRDSLKDFDEWVRGQGGF